MRLVPDPLRARPARRGWTDRRAWERVRETAPGLGRGSRIPPAGSLWPLFPSPPSLALLCSPHPLQAKETNPQLPPSPGTRWENWV